MERILEMIKWTINFCQWERLFRGECPGDWEEWSRISQLIAVREIMMKLGGEQDNPKSWEAAMEYATDVLVNSEEELQRGVDGRPVPFAPS
jgi:hypothetical protein